MSYSGVDLSGVSGLIQFSFGLRGRLYLVEINVDGDLSLSLVMGLLFLYG